MRSLYLRPFEQIFRRQIHLVKPFLLAPATGSGMRDIPSPPTVFMLKRQLIQKDCDAVIEDSEPERQEVRKRLKGEKRRRKEQKKVENLKVIELTDSDSNGSVPLRSTAPSIANIGA